ncbi:MAG: VWA domain-containing protein [Acidobacteriota bacterium]
MRLVLLLPIALCALFAVAQQDDVLHTSVTLVPVTVSITDRDGRPVEDIKAGELKLLDNGHPREIRYFDRDFDAPLTVGLITDSSGSQARFFAQHANTLKKFIGQVLRPTDQGFLVSIATPGPTMSDVQMVQDVTSSVADLRLGIEDLEDGIQPPGQFGDRCLTAQCRGSAIWNSVYSSTHLRMRSIVGRKALILLSDGFDTGSQHSLSTTIEEAQSADTPVYTLFTATTFAMPVFRGPRGRRGRRPIRKVQMPGKKEMAKLAEETGGRSFESAGSDVFAQIESELRHLYVLTFVVPENERDEKFHKLEVKLSRKGLRVRARLGYTAR